MPTCGPTDVPLNIASQCCPSCTLPMQVCSANVVVNCLNTTRACLTDESPSYVSGECCPTCYRPKPTPVSGFCGTPCGMFIFCVND